MDFPRTAEHTNTDQKRKSLLFWWIASVVVLLLLMYIMPVIHFLVTNHLTRDAVTSAVDHLQSHWRLDLLLTGYFRWFEHAVLEGKAGQIICAVIPFAVAGWMVFCGIKKSAHALKESNSKKGE